MSDPSPNRNPDALAGQYEAQATEGQVYRRWLEADAFRAVPDGERERYVVMMPLPNVTGALHMGHAMDNVMQDLLVRRKRMQRFDALWMPGTDHAGIATQAVVEKRLFELEGLSRHDVGREGLVDRIWEWKDEYQLRIQNQQQAMGCSCDWKRQRFTLDAVCSRAVRWTFFRLFEDGLIYRGNRLVNWDCALQTAVSDDEIVYKEVEGHFYHLRYPVIDPQPGEPTHVTVATTRPETMLGDTAVACHPEPRAELERLVARAKEKLAAAPAKERAEVQAEIAALESRFESHLPELERLVAMAADGRQVMLPLMDRPIPIIADEWAKPGLGSGVVKITPGHDPNDYEVWQRQDGRIGILNILEQDGRLNANAGAYAGQDRFDARSQVEADLEAAGLIGLKEERRIEMGHSDRSRTPIEPYLSRQWFVAMGDVEGGVEFGRGTDKAFRGPGLAQAAIDAVRGDWRSATGRKVDFFPDSERYASTYLNWLDEKRDWCISRQLWWGHRIPIWSIPIDSESVETVRQALGASQDRPEVAARIGLADGRSMALTSQTETGELAAFIDSGEDAELLVCPRDESIDAEFAENLESAGLKRDPDVLDTWFSSGIWPHSTLGWPDPETAELDFEQRSLAAEGDAPDALSAYYPGSCLVTGRDIITLWVARMVLMGLYNLGDVPFTDVFIHANILDGKGERMSKSKGNGIDPVDIIEAYGTDAMRYVLCEMQTGTQDIRLPVQAVSPFTGKLIDLAKAKHGSSIFTYLDPETGQEFDVLGTMPDLPAAKLISDRFTVGRNFCNKLWNATRFALMNLESGEGIQPLDLSAAAAEDRWIVSRLGSAISEVDRQLDRYNPAAAQAAARDFFWNEYCDWYLELIKPRIEAGGEDAAAARQVMAFCLDQVLRLFHPFIPFITEALWSHLGRLAPARGLARALDPSALLIDAAWPEATDAPRDADLEARLATAQELVRALRDIRNQYQVPPKQQLEAILRASGQSAEDMAELSHVICQMAGLSSLVIRAEAERSPDAATAVVGEMEAFLLGVVDPDQERKRLEGQLENLAKRIGGLEGRLGNAQFLERAKPEVVAGAREQLAELLSQREGLQANLTALEEG